MMTLLHLQSHISLDYHLFVGYYSETKQVVENSNTRRQFVTNVWGYVIVNWPDQTNTKLFRSLGNLTSPVLAQIRGTGNR